MSEIGEGKSKHRSAQVISVYVEPTSWPIIFNDSSTFRYVLNNCPVEDPADTCCCDCRQRAACYTSRLCVGGFTPVVADEVSSKDLLPL